MMEKSLEQLDYKGIFQYFSEISKIPRGSGNELEISNFLVSFAKNHNLEYTQDDAKNVIIIKEATSGYENEPAIILQGHMDMVCEKRKEDTHDFLKDGIKLIVEDDFLHAEGTTLGADNGIAVAYILAILSDEKLEHPRLEAIVTTDEEVGMNGAKALDASKLQAKYMINLDSEEEGYLLCSCAGGLTGTGTLPVKRITNFGKSIKISIGGLKGGHSGMEINKNRSNATKLLARILFELKERGPYSLLQMNGGHKDNVIPREAQAEIFIPLQLDEEGNPYTDEKKYHEAFHEISGCITLIMEELQKELSSSEPELNFQIEDQGNGIFNPLHPSSFEKLLFILMQMPYGVQVMSADIEGLVESSVNLGIFRLEEEQAIICNSIRSSKSSYKHFLSSRLNYLISFLGGEYHVRAEYPAWEFKKESPLREHLKRIYSQLYGEEMIVEAIHAGLECGIIHEKIPGIDIVSIGPNMSGVHTIEEKLSISSTIRVYQFLEKVLQEKFK